MTQILSKMCVCVRAQVLPKRELQRAAVPRVRRALGRRLAEALLALEQRGAVHRQRRPVAGAQQLPREGAT